MSEEDRVSLARMEEKVTQWMSTTNEYRVNLCSKIDNIYKRFDKLPCRERGLGTKLLWTALGVVGTLLFFHLGWK
jgi:hypothetical protein